MMILIWLIIGFGIYYLIKDNRNVNFKAVKNTTVEDTLKQRYVNGEIDDESYTRMLKMIKE